MGGINPNYAPKTPWQQQPPGPQPNDKVVAINTWDNSVAPAGTYGQGQARSNALENARGTRGAGDLTGGNWTPQSAPGAAENYWSQYGGQFNQPGPSQQYWNGQQGWFANPTSNEAMTGHMGNQLYERQGAAETAYNQVNNSGAFTQPGSYEQWYGQHGGDMNGPGQGGQALQGLLGQYGQQGQGEGYYGQTQGYYGAPGAMEQMYGQHGQDLMGPGMLQQREGGIQGQINGAHNLQDYFGTQAGNLTGPGYTERLAQGGAPQSSYGEDFLTGGGAGAGLNSLYDRLYSQGARRLDDRAGAGGSFNSGASLRAQEEMGLGLDAQHVRDYQAAVGQADAAKQARLGYGLNLMQGADTSMGNRIGLGFQGAQGMDTTSLARGNALMNLGQGLSQEKRGNFDSSFNAAQGTQGASLARVLGGQQSADSAFNERLARMTGIGNTANMMNQNDINRFQTGQGAAEASQRALFDRIAQGRDFANTAQTQEQNRIKQASDLQRQQQDMELQRMLGGLQGAQGASNERQLGLTSGMNAANTAQNSQETRQNDVFNNLRNLANDQAGVYGNQTGAANTEQTGIAITKIQGLLQGGKISAEEAQQLSNLVQQGLQIPLSVLDQLSSKKKNGG